MIKNTRPKRPSQVTNYFNTASKPKRLPQPQRNYEILTSKGRVVSLERSNFWETAHDEGKRAHFGSGFSRV
jgi:hypothetical protein